jgi:chromosome segregation ATPase
MYDQPASMRSSLDDSQQAVQVALADAVAEIIQLKHTAGNLAAQLADVTTQHKTFSEKSKSKLEQKDQAIDALTLQVSSHIGTIAEMNDQISSKDRAVELLHIQLQEQKAQFSVQSAHAEELALQQQQLHAAAISDLEAQIASIQTQAASQLHLAREAAAEAAQELGLQLQHTMQVALAHAFGCVFYSFFCCRRSQMLKNLSNHSITRLLPCIFSCRCVCG